MKKIILISLPIAVLLFGFAGYQYINKSSKDIVATKADLSVHATNLVRSFNSDTAIAKQQYLNKTIKVTGKVKSVDPAGAVVLEGPDEESSVVCGLDPRHIGDLSQLQPGTIAVVQGLCTSYEKGEEMLGIDLGTTVQIAFAGIKKP